MKQLSLFGADEKPLADARKETHHFTLFIDGASRNNPGKSGAGVYLLRDSKVVCEQGFYLGIRTNNQAEYLAFLLGLFFISQYHQPGDTVRIVSDSQLLVRQISGQYKVKNEALKPLHKIAHQMVRLYDAHVAHVLRTDNKKADAMANVGVDEKNPLPDAFIDMLKRHGVTL